MLLTLLARLTHEQVGWKLIEEQMALRQISFFADVWNPGDFGVKSRAGIA